MKFSSLAWILGGSLAAATSGLAIAACSSSSGTGLPTSPANDASTSDRTTTTTPDTGSQPGSDSSTIGDGGTTKDANCGTAPALHPSDGGSIYCPNANNDGGSASAIRCTPQTEHCCEVADKFSGASSTCKPIAQACDFAAVDGGGYDFKCDDPQGCPANQMCCGQIANANTPALNNQCNTYFATSRFFTGAECKTSCTAAQGDAGGEIRLCAKNEDCGSNGTCQAFDLRYGKQIGFCK